MTALRLQLMAGTWSSSYVSATATTVAAAAFAAVMHIYGFRAARILPQHCAASPTPLQSGTEFVGAVVDVGLRNHSRWLGCQQFGMAMCWTLAARPAFQQVAPPMRGMAVSGERDQFCNALGRRYHACRRQCMRRNLEGLA